MKRLFLLTHSSGVVIKTFSSLRIPVGIVVIAFAPVFLSDCRSQAWLAEKTSPTWTTPEPDGDPPPSAEKIDEPEIPVRQLNKKQKRELDSTLPPRVREVLEKADVLEIRGLSSEEKAGIGWYPDVHAILSTEADRKELLSAFYYDASAGPNPSACFIPRHSLRATYKGKTVEVIICYQCHLFSVQGDFGEIDGGMYLEGSAAHRIFHKIMSEKGEPIK